MFEPLVLKFELVHLLSGNVSENCGKSVDPDHNHTMQHQIWVYIVCSGMSVYEHTCSSS